MDIRKYILFEYSDASIVEVSSFLGSYLKNIYSLFEMVMDKFVQPHYKKEKVNKQKLSKIENILERGIIEYDNPLSYQRMIASLKRVSLEDMNESRFLKTMRTAGAIISLIATLISLRSVIKKIQNTKKEASRLDFNKRQINYFFSTIIKRRLERILSDLIDNKIRISRELKFRFYKIIDALIKEEPDLEPYLSAWSV